VLTAPPAPPPPLVLVAPAEREASFGRVAGRVPRGRWVLVVRVGTRTLAVCNVAGGSFDFGVSLPRRDATIRVTAYTAHGRARSASVRHVLGLPRSASPHAIAGARDGRLEVSVRSLTRSFAGTSALFVEDLVTGHGTAWNARARFPAASTLKVAIAVEALRAHAGKPEHGSYLDSLLRRMLIESNNEAANAVEATFGGGRRVDELLRGIGLVDTWMGGGYLRETAARNPIPARVESQPSFGCCKYTTASDLARLFTYVHLAAGGRGPLIRRYGDAFTPSDARVFVAAVMTWGSGVGASSDVLAGRVARATLARLRHP